MSANAPKHTEATRQRWDQHARRYDAYYETFLGAIEHHVDWELLRTHLPPNRDARILDAAGGTGRMTLPLARMGYHVTLCDISLGMLEVAKQKLMQAGLLARVEILECDICDLGCRGETFDLVLSWIGMLEAASELVRVAKKGGTLSLYLVNRCRGAIDIFSRDPASALALAESRSDYSYDRGGKYRAVSPEEARACLGAAGIRVIDTYALCGWLDLLGIPKEVQESGTWDAGFFDQVAEMVLSLSRASSVAGMARHVVLYGEKA